MRNFKQMPDSFFETDKEYTFLLFGCLEKKSVVLRDNNKGRAYAPNALYSYCETIEVLN